MKNEMATAAKPQVSESSEVCCARDTGASRKLGGVLVGVGGASALLAVLCCAAPWLLGGLLAALGLGFILKDSVLLTLAAVGLLVAFAGWWLKHKRTNVEGGQA